jgi:sn1-specific diacylglycerol lipase
MQYADLFPPGRIIWAMPDHQFDERNRKNFSSTFGLREEQTSNTSSPNVLRVFEVQRVEDVFGQVMFAKDMLSSHFVQNYDKVLHDCL